MNISTGLSALRVKFCTWDVLCQSRNAFDSFTLNLLVDVLKWYWRVYESFKLCLQTTLLLTLSISSSREQYLGVSWSPCSRSKTSRAMQEISEDWFTSLFQKYVSLFTKYKLIETVTISVLCNACHIWEDSAVLGVAFK